jgi:hypothetical protein
MALSQHQAFISPYTAVAVENAKNITTRIVPTTLAQRSCGFPTMRMVGWNHWIMRRTIGTGSTPESLCERFLKPWTKSGGRVIEDTTCGRMETNYKEGK